jgi:hypothetical protein
LGSAFVRFAADVRRTTVGPLPHNLRAARGDAYAIGIVKAGGPFVSVLLIRIGATPLEIGLVTAIPAMAGLLLSVPIGLFLQRSSAIVRIYSRARLIAGVGWVAMAVAAATLPQTDAIAVVLAIWALASVPTVGGAVAFPIVMSAAAGPEGRYEIMGIRFAIAALTTGIAAVVIGFALDALPFALNYLLVFAGLSLAGLISFHFARQFQIRASEAPHAPKQRMRLWSSPFAVRRYPRFLRFQVRQLIFRGGMLVVVPLLPLYYVDSLGASDSWIGILVAGQSAAAVAGYMFWRSRSRRWTPAGLVVLPLIVVALQPLLASLTSSLVVILLISTVTGFFAAGVNLALFDALMEAVPRHRAPTFSGIDMAGVSAVGVVAPMIGGLAAQAVGVEMALWMGTAICLTGAGLFAVDIRQGPRLAGDRDGTRS